MRREIGTLTLTACVLCGTAALADPVLTEFDAPGAHSTYVSGIGKGGDISGVYVLKSGAGGGYVRKAGGDFVVFDQAIYAEAVNADGEAAGYTQNGTNDAFVADVDGTVTAFSPPGAGRFGALADAIDARGNAAGYYYDDAVVVHGFWRGHGGGIVTFEAPGAGTRAEKGTYVTGLASGGIVAGYTLDDTNVFHGFLRAKDGSFTMIDVEGAGDGAKQGTRVLCVSGNGTVGGYYKKGRRAFHGFLRDIAGNVVTFDVPGALNTVVYGVNNQGAAVGIYNAETGSSHGFERLPSGDIVTIDAPDAGHAPDEGTFPTGINDSGEIAGYYLSRADVEHGFFRTN